MSDLQNRASPADTPGMADFIDQYGSGQFERALKLGLSLTQKHATSPYLWSGIAGCCVFLKQWKLAVTAGLAAWTLDPDNLHTLDALSHASGMLEDWASVQRYGHAALALRDRPFAQNGVGADGFAGFEPAEPLPFLPECDRNAICFSLFGGDSKYCESAILNAQEVWRIYPGWHCRFFVDDSVPAEVKRRLLEAGARLIEVDAEMRHWPGTMWRFSASEDPTLDRILFRDADSVISEREAGAVEEWLQSGKPFHIMRDAGAHTELILAGLWACSRGSLPPMRALVEEYLSKGAPSGRFTDQRFLSKSIWPLARDRVLQHDSLFAFRNPRPFPEGPHRTDFHTGFNESSARLHIQFEAPQGTRVRWRIIDHAGPQPVEVCSYLAVVDGWGFDFNLPQRYLKHLSKRYSVEVG